jgi:predicted site-specific integrase-resolvase
LRRELRSWSSTEASHETRRSAGPWHAPSVTDVSMAKRQETGRAATTGAVGAVVYCRVSTKEQTQNLSLDTQRRSCLKHCEQNGWTVREVFREEGESAKTANRPELLRMLAYCRENKSTVQHVVVYRIDGKATTMPC